MILFCFVFYISSQFQAAGNALTEVFGLSTGKSILVGAAVILIYCLLGGFLAASITDAVQALVMMLACILVPIAALQAAGGFGDIFATLKAQEPYSYFSLTGKSAGLVGIGAAMGLLGSEVSQRTPQRRGHHDWLGHYYLYGTCVLSACGAGHWN